MLFEVVVLASKAYEPTAVFLAPVVFSFNACLPTAVLLFPVVFPPKLAYPIATLFVPLVLASKALQPRTVLDILEFAPLPTVNPLIVKSSLFAIFAAVTASFAILAEVITPS